MRKWGGNYGMAAHDKRRRDGNGVVYTGARHIQSRVHSFPNDFLEYHPEDDRANPHPNEEDIL